MNLVAGGTQVSLTYLKALSLVLIQIEYMQITTDVGWSITLYYFYIKRTT